MEPELSEEFLKRVGVHQGSVLLLLLLFAIPVDVVSKNAKDEQILYADKLVLMSEMYEEFEREVLK